MYLLPLLYTQFPSVAFEERQNECFSAWKILRRDPKHVYKGQIKSNPLKADRPSMEVPCYPRVWSLLHALSSKRSENQVASSCTAHNLCLAEVLNWNGCCYLCKVKWHCPNWLRVSLWNPEGLKPICPQGSRNGCNAGMSVRYNISGSLVLPSLQETSALCQRHLLHPVPTPWHWGLFMQNCSQLPWDLCLGEDSAKQTHYI